MQKIDYLPVFYWNNDRQNILLEQNLNTSIQKDGYLGKK